MKRIHFLIVFHIVFNSIFIDAMETPSKTNIDISNMTEEQKKYYQAGQDHAFTLAKNLYEPKIASHEQRFQEIHEQTLKDNGALKRDAERNKREYYKVQAQYSELLTDNTRTQNTLAETQISLKAKEDRNEYLRTILQNAVTPQDIVLLRKKHGQKLAHEIRKTKIAEENTAVARQEMQRLKAKVVQQNITCPHHNVFGFLYRQCMDQYF